MKMPKKSKRAMCVGTKRNKFLKQTLIKKFFNLRYKITYGKSFILTKLTKAFTTIMQNISFELYG